MKKILKWTGIFIIALPFVLILLWIGYQIFGASMNALATAKQTKQIQKHIQDTWQNANIIDTYSETGNTSGTGNHVDMSSVVLFRVDEDLDGVIEKLSAEYEFNATDCWVQQLDVVISYHQKDSGYYNFLEHMELPDDTDYCYIFVQNQSAPFADNIVGH